jgi:uncharacterized protein YjiS (DUF1127 family)
MLSPNRNLTTPAQDRGKANPRLLREDHVLCLVMDAVLAAQVALRRWSLRRRNRQALATLDEHALRDIGLTRGAATTKRLTHHESKGRSSHVPISPIHFAGR